MQKTFPFCILVHWCLSVKPSHSIASRLLFTVTRSAMRVFFVVGITLVCVIVLVCSVCAVVGVVLICIMVSLVLSMSFTRNSVSVFCHVHSPFHCFSILSQKRRTLTTNHMVQKSKGYPLKRDILHIDTGNLNKAQQSFVVGLSLAGTVITHRSRRNL